MSAVIRSGCLSTVKRGITFLTSRDVVYRKISTSPKKEETNEQTLVERKSWYNYGFDTTHEKSDDRIMHHGMFMSVSIFLVIIGIYYIYHPDYNLRNWAQREAYLQIRYREEHGLPLIDPNFIDPSKITLPDDSELSDDDIII